MFCEKKWASSLKYFFFSVKLWPMNTCPSGSTEAHWQLRCWCVSGRSVVDMLADLTVSVHKLVLVVAQRWVEVGWRFSLHCLVRTWWLSRSISLCLSAPAIRTRICLEIANLSSESTSWATGKRRWPYLDLHGEVVIKLWPHTWALILSMVKR